MPLYEYDCPKCGTFEVTQKITEAKLETCPTCSKPVQRLISSTSFALKGGGWYSDLYSGSGSKGGSNGTAT